MLMDLKSLNWSDFMLAEFGIKKEALPEIKLSSSDNYGAVANIECIKDVLISG
jgi:glycerol kinase